MVLKHHHHYHFSYQLLTALTSSPLPFPSIFPPSLQPLLTYMARHHLPTWSWEPSLNLQHHYQHLHQAVQQEAHCEREHMFEKLLTPSDVGKLNRLVIPKQHAEKYFPLDGDSGKKGLLLSFEDESGKTWEFRYSYWSSSQSYVLTRGWSRFVKEKRLDTGDVVLFERPWFDSHRPYIRCRRRRGSERLPSAQTMTMANAACSYPTTSSYFSSMQQDRLLHTRCQMDEAVQSETVAPANSTRLRLFGVNLGCRPGPEPQSMTSTSWLLGQSACQFMPSNASTSQL